MKNILSSLTSSEKNRILEMHKSATKKLYLKESDEDSPWVEWNSSITPNHPELKASEAAGVDFIVDRGGLGHLNLETPINGKGAIYFKCNSPIAIWKDGTSMFNKDTQKTEYDSAYNIFKKYCDQAKANQKREFGN